MHIRALAVLQMPPGIEEEKKNQAVRKMIAEMKNEKFPEGEDFMNSVFISALQGRLTTFAREVSCHITDIMEPYSMEPSEEYLEFDDKTEVLHSEYEKNVDCLKLPEGKIVELYQYPYSNAFCVFDGKVYQKDAGPLHHEKRTKKAKRIKALPNYPRSKVYKNFEEYVENVWGYPFNEEHQAYGYYCNPNAKWDWYEIGGRWPEMFLVKDDCFEQSQGERSWCNRNDILEAPEGYIWAAAARKKDICWEVMREWKIQKATKKFYYLEKMFYSGKLDDGFFGLIKDDGIINGYGYVYCKGETLEEYLERCAIPKAWKYPFNVHCIIDADSWFSKDDLYEDGKTGEYLYIEWCKKMEEYVAALDEEAILVGIDYHA